MDHNIGKNIFRYLNGIKYFGRLMRIMITQMVKNISNVSQNQKIHNHIHTSSSLVAILNLTSVYTLTSFICMYKYIYIYIYNM
jgi:hypothetical protein